MHWVSWYSQKTIVHFSASLIVAPNVGGLCEPTHQYTKGLTPIIGYHNFADKGTLLQLPTLQSAVDLLGNLHQQLIVLHAVSTDYLTWQPNYRRKVYRNHSFFAQYRSSITVILKSLMSKEQSSLVTIAPTASIVEAVQLLSQHDIGALLVSSAAKPIEGMLSERDIVRSLADPLQDTLSLRVQQLMTANVHTCSLNSTVAELMSLMTSKRIRHVPVLHDGKLSGMVSIGDVVRARLGELEVERRQIEEYITG